MSRRWWELLGHSRSPAFAVRALLALPLLALPLAVGCGQGAGPTGPSPPSPKNGQLLYEKDCALCHGVHGEGYVADNATALANPNFLAVADDGFLTLSITRGRPGTTMSAWGYAFAGPLSGPDVSDVIAYLKSWRQGPLAPGTDAATVGDVSRGGATYGANCAVCHGATGQEGPYARVANAEFLADANDTFLRYTIENGRPPTAMPAYGAALPPPAVEDVITLLRSWQKPVPPGDVPFPGSFGPIVQNPGGQDPAFTAGQRFTPADVVHAELSAGKKMAILDARAPSDYVAGHVAGATDVPFYEASSYLAQLPRDVFIVCYCACPHAESGSLTDTLLAAGFPRVTIIDEGFFVWRDRGYPVHTGAMP